MKRYLGVLLMITLALFLFSQNALSYPVSVGQLIKFQNGVGSTAGGEFKVMGALDPDGIYDDFLVSSFCLETDEFLNFSNTFEVYSITNYADGGGSGGPSPDPLSDQSAWIYWSWYTGGLSYITDPVQRADDTQQAIWTYEQENFSANNSTWQDLYAKAQLAYDGGWRNDGRVAVMNIWDPIKKVKKQSQLIMVPEPGNMLLMGTGIILLVGIGRRRVFKKQNS